MENKIPTSEEFIEKGIKEGLGLEIKNFKKENPVLYSTIKSIVLKSNELHVKAALKAASEESTINYYDEHGQYSPFINEESILNAYPLTNIK